MSGVEFTEADLPTLRKLRDMMGRFADEARERRPADPLASDETLIYRIQTRFCAEFCARIIIKIEKAQQTNAQ